MNWSAVAAIASLIGICVTIMGVTYVAGEVRGEVRHQGKRLDKADERLDRHDEHLTEHTEKLGRLEEWKNGFNAAARVSGRETK